MSTLLFKHWNLLIITTAAVNVLRAGKLSNCESQVQHLRRRSQGEKSHVFYFKLLLSQYFIRGSVMIQTLSRVAEMWVYLLSSFLVFLMLLIPKSHRQRAITIDI